MIETKDENGNVCYVESPIHGWFELTYASYLVLPRVLLQEMPLEWQEKMVKLLEEMEEEFPNIQGGSYRVLKTKNGKLVKTPEWEINYRRPNRDMIASCRKGLKP